MTEHASCEVILAPMAGVTDLAMRELCIEQGADLTFTEMVSAKGLSYANEKTRHLLELGPHEARVGVQLFGHEPSVMACQAAWVEQELGERLAIIDINMGCPARKIVKKGDGSALMREPALAAHIVREVRAAVEAPVSVKMRRGWAQGDETAPDFARRMEEAGVSRLTVHGRFALQLYHGDADWGCIARVKQAVSLPVIGNGDIRCGADACAMLDETGCDHLMIARGAEGNPWIFADVKVALAQAGYLASAPSVPFTPPTYLDRIEMARRHAQLLEDQGSNTVVRMRKHAMWYLRGLTGASHARSRLNYCSTLNDFEAVFDEVAAHLSAEKDGPCTP